MVIWLLMGGLFCTFYLRVRPFKDAKQTFRVVRGMLARKSDPGEVTSFQAFATELAGTIGLGNIFKRCCRDFPRWTRRFAMDHHHGLLGMALKLAEATLSQMFRRVNSDGSISGGPMYYLKDGSPQ